jgi:hypothetical protein
MLKRLKRYKKRQKVEGLLRVAHKALKVKVLKVKNHITLLDLKCEIPKILDIIKQL